MALSANRLYLLIPDDKTHHLDKAIEGFYPEWLQMHKAEDNFRVYHYTDLSGLQGILRERSLWFGHVSTLNDTLEIQYGQKLVAKVLTDLMEAEVSKHIHVFYDHLLNSVGEFFTDERYQVFVASFCDSGNSLSQWRGYANRGGGYCLGFECSPSTRTSDIGELGNPSPIILRKVIYQENQQRELVMKYLKCIIAGAREDIGLTPTWDSLQETDPVMMAMQAADVLLDMLLTFKHPAFAEEKEWRLMRVTLNDHLPDRVCFREAGGMLIPYRPMHIFDEADDKFLFPLRSISCGPSLEPNRAQAAVNLFLHHIAASQHPITVKPSNVHFVVPGYNIR